MGSGTLPATPVSLIEKFGRQDFYHLADVEWNFLSAAGRDITGRTRQSICETEHNDRYNDPSRLCLAARRRRRRTNHFM